MLSGGSGHRSAVMASIPTLTLNPTIDKSAEVDHVTSEK